MGHASSKNGQDTSQAFRSPSHRVDRSFQQVAGPLIYGWAYDDVSNGRVISHGPATIRSLWKSGLEENDYSHPFENIMIELKDKGTGILK